jgi:RNA polymerase sigma factor (sigma-70 family)
VIVALGPFSEANQATLERLLKQVDRLPRLSAEEELALVRRWQRGEESARTTLLESGLRGVVFIALPYAKGGDLPMDDLVQEGCLALTTGLEHFDPDRGVRLMTFLSFRIRGQLSEFVWSRHGVAKPGRHERSTIRLIMACQRKLRRDLGAEPRIADIAWALNLPEATVSEVRANAQSLVSVDLVRDVDLSDDGPDVQEETRREQERRRLNDFVAVLPPEQALVISLLCGLDGHTPLTHRQIGDVMDQTAYRVTLIQEEAEAKLGPILATRYADFIGDRVGKASRPRRERFREFAWAVDF